MSMSFKILAAVAIPLLLVIAIFGCNWESGESYSLSQNQNNDISGAYGVTVSPFSSFTTMILRHTGNKLEGTDNLARTWRGHVSGLPDPGIVTAQPWDAQIYLETDGPPSGKIRGEVLVMETEDTVMSPVSGYVYEGDAIRVLIVEGEYTKDDGKVGPFAMYAISYIPRASLQEGEEDE